MCYSFILAGKTESFVYFETWRQKVVTRWLAHFCRLRIICAFPDLPPVADTHENNSSCCLCRPGNKLYPSTTRRRISRFCSQLYWPANRTQPDKIQRDDGRRIIISGLQRKHCPLPIH